LALLECKKTGKNSWTSRYNSTLTKTQNRHKYLQWDYQSVTECENYSQTANVSQASRCIPYAHSNKLQHNTLLDLQYTSLLTHLYISAPATLLN